MFSVIIALRRFHSSLSCYVMDFTSWFHVMVLVRRISLLIYNIMYLLNICNFKDHVHLYTDLVFSDLIKLSSDAGLLKVFIE